MCFLPGTSPVTHRWLGLGTELMPKGYSIHIFASKSRSTRVKVLEGHTYHFN